MRIAKCEMTVKLDLCMHKACQNTTCVGKDLSVIMIYVSTKHKAIYLSSKHFEGNDIMAFLSGSDFIDYN